MTVKILRCYRMAIVCLAVALAMSGMKCPAAGENTNIQADLVFLNGVIYTVDAARRWEQAVAIRDGRIAYVGTDRGAREFVGPKTSVIDLTGRMVLPGLIDSHVHLIDGGIEQGFCDLADAESREDLYEKIRQYASLHPDQDWIRGSGWPLTLFRSASPKKEDLDALVESRPVYLASADHHSAWVNSAALKAAGITNLTADPAGGRIERDSKTGQATGTLRESAMALVESKLPVLTGENYLAGLAAGQKLALSYGITSIQDACVSREHLAAYASLDKAGGLNVRVRCALRVDAERGLDQVDDLVAMRETFKGGRLNAGSAKIFADGVIEARTAALLEPYLGENELRECLNYKPDAMKKLVSLLDKKGFQVHIHAIGDGAVRCALDAMESSRNLNGDSDRRHHIAHLELIDSEDISRFAKLDVVANFQGYWAQRDKYISGLTEPVLGAKRSRAIYPLGSLIAAGAVVAGGSDWPVTTLNPFYAIEVAVTRKPVGKKDGKSWLPDQKASLKDMLAAYTINGAYVNHQDRLVGSIEPGKLADLIVIDRNLFAVAPESIHETRVLLTLVEGREVFRDPDFR